MEVDGDARKKLAKNNSTLLTYRELYHIIVSTERDEWRADEL